MQLLKGFRQFTMWVDSMTNDLFYIGVAIAATVGAFLPAPLWFDIGVGAAIVWMVFAIIGSGCRSSITIADDGSVK
jgi:hypothetical protein